MVWRTAPSGFSPPFRLLLSCCRRSWRQRHCASIFPSRPMLVRPSARNYSQTMFAYANPKRFMEVSGRVLPWLSGATAILFAVGLYLSFAAPPDYQQGNTVRIMFVHVPAAWVAMMAYGFMALAS